MWNNRNSNITTSGSLIITTLGKVNSYFKDITRTNFPFKESMASKASILFLKTANPKQGGALAVHSSSSSPYFSNSFSRSRLLQSGAKSPMCNLVPSSSPSLLLLLLDLFRPIIPYGYTSDQSIAKHPPITKIDVALDEWMCLKSPKFFLMNVICWM